MCALVSIIQTKPGTFLLKPLLELYHSSACPSKMQLGSRFHNLAEATSSVPWQITVWCKFQSVQASDTFLGISLGEPALEHG